MDANFAIYRYVFVTFAHDSINGSYLWAEAMDKFDNRAFSFLHGGGAQEMS